MTETKTDSITAVLLAAGKGTRMKSGFSKLTHELSGKPIIRHLKDSLVNAGVDRIIAVVGHDSGRVKDALGKGVEFALQNEQLGTAHAVLAAMPLLKDCRGDLLVFVGDCPLISPELIKQLVNKRRKTDAAISILTTSFDETPPYARIIRDKTGSITAIKEENVCSEEEKEIKEVNTSHYCFDAGKILPLMPEIDNENPKNEYYLTDINGLALNNGMKIENVFVADPVKILGMNDRYELSLASRFLKERFFKNLMISGVTIKDPDSTSIDVTVKIGMDTVIYPGSVIEKDSVIKSGCQIGPHVHIRSSNIGNRAVLSQVSVNNCTVEADVNLIPFRKYSNQHIK